MILVGWCLKEKIAYCIIKWSTLSWNNYFDDTFIENEFNKFVTEIRDYNFKGTFSH